MIRVDNKITSRSGGWGRVQTSRNITGVGWLYSCGTYGFDQIAILSFLFVIAKHECKRDDYYLLDR